MIGEQQVTTVSGESLQGIDNLVGNQVTWQVLPTFFYTNAVAHHPAHRVVLDVEIVNFRCSQNNALACIYIILLEPSHCVFFIVAGGVVVSHEHSDLLVNGSAYISQTVGSELLKLILIVVGAADVPLVSCKTNSEDAARISRRRIEVDDTSTAVVHHMVPSTQHVAIGQILPGLDDIGIRSKAIGVEVPHTVVVSLETCTLEGIDTALVESADKFHTTIDFVTRVVVDLSLGIADDRL